MNTLLITPKDKSELKLLSKLLKKMKISSKVLTNEENENIVLAEILKNIDRAETVNKEKVMAILDEIEEKEDAAMIIAMKEADRTQKVDLDKFMTKLAS